MPYTIIILITLVRSLFVIISVDFYLICLQGVQEMGIAEAIVDAVEAMPQGSGKILL